MKMKMWWSCPCGSGYIQVWNRRLTPVGGGINTDCWWYKKAIPGIRVIQRQKLPEVDMRTKAIRGEEIILHYGFPMTRRELARMRGENIRSPEEEEEWIKACGYR